MLVSSTPPWTNRITTKKIFFLFSSLTRPTTRIVNKTQTIVYHHIPSKISLDLTIPPSNHPLISCPCPTSYLFRAWTLHPHNFPLLQHSLRRCSSSSSTSSPSCTSSSSSRTKFKIRSSNNRHVVPVLDTTLDSPLADHFLKLILL